LVLRDRARCEILSLTPCAGQWLALERPAPFSRDVTDKPQS